MSIINDVIKLCSNSEGGCSVYSCFCSCLKGVGNYLKWRCLTNSLRKLCGCPVEVEDAQANGSGSQTISGQEIPPQSGYEHNSRDATRNTGPVSGNEVAWWEDPSASNHRVENQPNANALISMTVNL